MLPKTSLSPIGIVGPLGIKDYSDDLVFIDFQIEILYS